MRIAFEVGCCDNEYHGTKLGLGVCMYSRIFIHFLRRLLQLELTVASPIFSPSRHWNNTNQSPCFSYSLKESTEKREVVLFTRYNSSTLQT